MTHRNPSLGAGARGSFMILGVVIGGMALRAAAQTACPPGHVSEGGDASVTCHWDLGDGGEIQRNCAQGNACKPGQVVGCCPVISGGVVVSVKCICKAAPTGGCAPNSLELCE